MTTALFQLTDHEATIERGLKTFVDVGNALAAIRDGKLYRADHATFEDYCKVRWGWARNYANKMIAAAEVTRSLGTNVPSPATESQARPLTKLPAAEQAEAWEEVVAESEQTGEKITAKKVEQVVASNAQHGLRRTNADKRRSVMILLDDAEWAQWSDREIAQHIGVSPSTVAKYRDELAASLQIGEMAERKVTRNGKTYTQSTANIGRKPEPIDRGARQ